MTSLLSAREKAVCTNSLICLLQALSGEITTVELRNESSATGLILGVDSSMNVFMSNVTYTDERRQYSLENFYIRGRNIRYVHIPDKVSYHRVLLALFLWTCAA